MTANRPHVSRPCVFSSEIMVLGVYTFVCEAILKTKTLAEWLIPRTKTFKVCLKSSVYHKLKIQAVNRFCLNKGEIF